MADMSMMARGVFFDIEEFAAALILQVKQTHGVHSGNLLFFQQHARDRGWLYMF